MKPSSNPNGGRPKNRSETVSISITVTEQVAEALDKIADTGFYGTNRASAAERLLCEGIRKLLQDGIIAKTQKAML